MSKPVKQLSTLAKKKILNEAQRWFIDVVATNHAKNTRKLSRPSKLTINPFTAVYLANFLSGDSSPKSIAKALIYPRSLGTSISTSFGNNIQKFASQVLGTFGSPTAGIDIEFIDRVDGRKKYCQLKAGPNNINSSGVKTIYDKFGEIKRTASQNSLVIGQDDLIVGVIYGTESELSEHFRKLRKKHRIPIHIGKDFWMRLTGDPGFYVDLIASIREVAETVNFRKDLQSVVGKLSKEMEIVTMSTGGKPAAPKI